jgi:anti-sigma B factor antagonist
MIEWTENISGEQATLSLSGKITFENSGELRNRVKAILSEFPLKHLSFDLAGVRFVDSSGLGLLVSIKNTMVKRDGSFKIDNAAETVRNIMNQTGLDKYFEI